MQRGYVIPNWNGGALLTACVDSILQYETPAAAAIVVIDNASGDGSAEAAAARPGVRVLRNAVNRGYAPAANQGVDALRTPWLFVLNSDVTLEPGCADALVRHLEAHPEAALAAPRVRRPGGGDQWNARRLPTLPRMLAQALGLHRIVRAWDDPRPPGAAPHAVEMLDACLWCVRRAAWEAVGPFDERFVFFGEDMDWCRRARALGWQVHIVPGAEAMHLGGGSSAGVRDAVLRQGFRARHAYFRKHRGRIGGLLCAVCFVLLELRRIAVSSALAPFRASARSALRRDARTLHWLIAPHAGRTRERLFPL